MRAIDVRTLVVLSAVSLNLTGCSQANKPAPDAAGQQAASAEHNHDGWWCDEHGVPEEVCARCDVKLVAVFKQQGDWCEKHDRPDSQCFVCHPEKEAEFAAQYEAKYGKQPPKPEDDHDHDHDHQKQS